MRNLLQFIIRYSNLLLFIGLELVAMLFVFSRSGLPRHAWMTSSNAMIGACYEARDAVLEYFLLRRDNERLMAENIELQNRIVELENALELAQELNLSDTVTSYVYADKQLSYIPAKVINYTTSTQRNYLTLNKGSRDGIQVDQGVVDQDGVVGIVRAVSERFAVVIPVVNSTFSVSCRFLTTDKIGPLHWDGIDSRYAQLEDIARHVEVHEGDTLVTSGLSESFPKGIRVGVVDQVKLSESDAYYHIRVRLAADFRRLSYVQVISNATYAEQKALESKEQ